jgi:probable HAF family extracellular repeat protein
MPLMSIAPESCARVSLTLSVLALAVAASCPAAQPQYTAVSLGTLGSSSAGYAINNAGEVTGVVNVNVSANLRTHAFYSNGSAGHMEDLDSSSTSTSIGLGINDSGVIVGTKIVGSEQHGIMRTGGGLIDLGRFGGVAGTNSTAYGINAAGQISGSYVPVGFGGATRIMRYENGVTTNGGALSVTGQHAFGYAINASGQMAATRSLAGVTSPYLWKSPTVFTALGNLGGTNGSAYGVNDAGNVVGTSQIAGNGATHAFLSTGLGGAGQMTDLGTLGGTNSSAFAINNAGQVVGNSNTSGAGGTQGFLYTNGTLYNLNQLVVAGSGVTNINLSANTPNTFPADLGSFTRHINDWGQIAATGTIDGVTRAIVLNPVNPLTSLSGDSTSRNTKFVSGMNYSLATAITDPNALHTSATLLGGVAGVNRSVDLGFGGASAALASDIVTVSGTGVDTFVLQLSYDPVLGASLFGSEANVRLGWFNPATQRWDLAVNGNIGGTNLFIAGGFDGSLLLGHYGIDTDANIVWAVLNHNSDFGAFGEVAAIPEPAQVAGIFGLLAAGAAAWRRKRRAECDPTCARRA